jgi:hypothetical protein
MTIIGYSRRLGDYCYDIEIDETTRLINAERFCARVVNVVRLQLGQTVPMTTDLPSVYGPTRHEAVSNIEAALAEWATAQQRSS